MPSEREEKIAEGQSQIGFYEEVINALGDTGLDYDEFMYAFRRFMKEGRFRQLSPAEKALKSVGRLQTVKRPESKHQAFPEIELIKKGLQIAGSPERLIEWMQTPVPSLKGQTPYSLMGTEEGRKQVEAALGRIEHGVY